MTPFWHRPLRFVALYRRLPGSKVHAVPASPGANVGAVPASPGAKDPGLTPITRLKPAVDRGDGQRHRRQPPLGGVTKFSPGSLAPGVAAARCPILAPGNADAVPRIAPGDAETALPEEHT